MRKTTEASTAYSVHDRPLRLDFLEGAKGLNWVQRLRMLPVRLIAGNYPAPMLVMSYHRRLYGKWFARFLQQATRESEEWAKEELELFGAFTAEQLACDF